MNQIAIHTALPAMTPEDIGAVSRLESELRTAPQTEVHTDHVFHAGMYARTVRIPAGTVMTGALIKRATLLILNGHAKVFTGADAVELVGYHVLPASAGRKQAFITYADTDLTMLFPTGAQSVEAAEAEFTDETGLLLSRQMPQTLRITGE